MMLAEKNKHNPCYCFFNLPKDIDGYATIFPWSRIHLFLFLKCALCGVIPVFVRKWQFSNATARSTFIPNFNF